MQSLSTDKLGANILNPTYKGRKLKENPFKSLYDKGLDEFLYRVCPRESLGHLSYYLKNLGEFFKSMELNLDPERYWHSVSRKYPELSEFGLELHAIPAILPQINVQELAWRQKYLADEFLVIASMNLIANAEKIRPDS